jgi:uncharacterized membrane protein YkvA (DUF1232 family)
MTEQSWKPVFRIPTSTITKILRSQAFLHSRECSATIAESPGELRALADLVEDLDHASAPLAAVADRVAAAVRFLRARADRLEAAPDSGAPNAGVATKERLLVAGLHYLVTPVDLVPDFKPGGYVDDVFLLAWVFGAATHELTPYLDDDLEGEEPASAEPQE